MRRRVLISNGEARLPCGQALGGVASAAGGRLCLRFEASSFPTHILNRDPRQTPQPQPALGRAIRELRGARDETQEQLAPRAGITPKTLSLIERGEANPTWGTVQGIADALGVSISELAHRAEKHR
jgi:DNA-binding XRE family transcriptional regulator